MTDEELESVLNEIYKQAVNGNISPRKSIERAYRLGWEERGKRDAEVCRSMTKDNVRPHLTDAYRCAIAIEREGTVRGKAE